MTWSPDAWCTGKNAFDGYTPSNPDGQRLDFGSPDFLQLEEGGLKAVGYAAFVLVAGGLGERLGYKGEQGVLASHGACCQLARAETLSSVCRVCRSLSLGDHSSFLVPSLQDCSCV